MAAGVECRWLEQGRWLEVSLAAPPGNILTIERLRALCEALEAAGQQRRLRAVLLAAAGEHFSYGASVHEHAPPHTARMLEAMGAAVRALIDLPALTIACVRGRCLGGGLELALACDRIVASPCSELGLPEIRLGVFAPVGSALLGLRVGEARAVQLACTGHALSAREALGEGLIDEVAERPREAAFAWARSGLGDKSAAALRHALWAARAVRRERLQALLPQFERRYLGALLETHDAHEGVAAFVQKRAPRFEDR